MGRCSSTPGAVPKPTQHKVVHVHPDSTTPVWCIVCSVVLHVEGGRCRQGAQAKCRPQERVVLYLLQRGGERGRVCRHESQRKREQGVVAKVRNERQLWGAAGALPEHLQAHPKVLKHGSLASSAHLPICQRGCRTTSAIAHCGRGTASHQRPWTGFLSSTRVLFRTDGDHARQAEMTQDRVIHTWPSAVGTRRTSSVCMPQSRNILEAGSQWYFSK